jgi:hypothetical protein
LKVGLTLATVETILNQQVEFLCYTFKVEEKYKFWRIWAGYLQRLGLDGFAAGLLEAAGPLSLIMAQLLYIGQPFFPSMAAQAQFHAFSELLEDCTETRSFIKFLREGMLT